MARGPSFDRDVVVERAMRVFWREGYQGASMAVLGTAMELRPGSIYAAFGSKEALFREALEMYTGRIRAAALGADVSPRRLLERWFSAHISAALDVPSGELGRGCLLMASAVEAPRLDPESAAGVRSQLETMERFFRECVRRARRDSGPRPDTLGPAATARLLVATLAGISSLSRVGASRRTLEDAARVALASV